MCFVVSPYPPFLTKFFLFLIISNYCILLYFRSRMIIIQWKKKSFPNKSKQNMWECFCSYFVGININGQLQNWNLNFRLQRTTKNKRNQLDPIRSGRNTCLLIKIGMKMTKVHFTPELIWAWIKLLVSLWPRRVSNQCICFHWT